MVKIRLSFDNQEEKKETLKLLNESFNLINVSKDYQDRNSKTFRVYVDAELK